MAGPLLRAGRSAESIIAECAALRASATGLEHVARATPFERSRRRERLEHLGVRIVPLLEPGYPEALLNLDDAPLVLSVRGQVDRLGDLSVAIVGARAATRSARGIARQLAFDLSRAGITIVSGLARGIDAEAHRGALDAGGATIGVLACGIDRIYPPEHRGLAQEMMQRGAVVSELPLGALPRPLHFPLRNRIISGLSRAVVVVEARARSGSLITVRHALAQGREVFVVPGAVDGPFAAGTNQLLREGARAIRSARDLLEDLGLGIDTDSSVSRRSVRAQGLAGSASRSGATGAIAEQLLALLSEGPRTADELIVESGLEPGSLAMALLELELAGRVAEDRDGRLHVAFHGSPASEHRDPGAPPLPCAPSGTTMPPPAVSAGLAIDATGEETRGETRVRRRDGAIP